MIEQLDYYTVLLFFTLQPDTCSNDHDTLIFCLYRMLAIPRGAVAWYQSRYLESQLRLNYHHAMFPFHFADHARITRADPRFFSRWHICVLTLYTSHLIRRRYNTWSRPAMTPRSPWATYSTYLQCCSWTQQTMVASQPYERTKLGNPTPFLPRSTRLTRRIVHHLGFLYVFERSQQLIHNRGKPADLIAAAVYLKETW